MKHFHKFRGNFLWNLSHSGRIGDCKIENVGSAESCRDATAKVKRTYSKWREFTMTNRERETLTLNFGKPDRGAIEETFYPWAL